MKLDEQQQSVCHWFQNLRDRICSRFEAIEQEAGSDACFTFVPWQRQSEEIEEDGGGGVRSLMNGRVFEKVGVNISTVRGCFSADFARKIPGTERNPHFFATGISLVAHMANPHVPNIHMNCRFLRTSKSWFGGGIDLNPSTPYEQDTSDFHHHLKEMCNRHNPDYYPRFSQWAEEYFDIPHRHIKRGVGGIFYDYLDKDFESDFAFTRDVGEAFLDIFPKLVARRQDILPNQEDFKRLNIYRGRYAEFNLLYDRGTIFGLKTGGNIEAILMSLPPQAVWK
ncbi:MAG: oxygen-dependent coproporphyrinogen oxidase [Zymomonas mobilis subsp. pomaceae]|uniref:coproporphyrinogen oxidase n=1 Tax=Zymomonas mobilis subsp. pomaceae (strain ATCC 29192 / DSM 22645 / JCM 10191 / CCUG 17912 / NBRC 13757 / NCIMB 11200 / NRRL B-4491 / Barker I) TaxID=579138 RepID=F8EUK6_ZYMMT|nr:oxygen-dependent coproporphyrinogen oxidase [Zymomonas mobilis]AEI37222.1 Coproporphyrinogen oxidase [Zymomonas mobilis subsp. pomaceae ATCC 29192]MDX5948592.1 oxygen-dependent coproporphyrinogen oxidase [Zymomonas mobilis subsp. pomaceae]GEB88398.1 oxygen-dependent coproporphyrinogen-III oxidase [Zymomonas mobilis subsp. pomaceae]